MPKCQLGRENGSAVEATVAQIGQCFIRLSQRIDSGRGDDANPWDETEKI